MRSSVLAAAVLAIGCATASAQSAFPGTDWQQGTPESQGLDSAKLQAAMDYYGSAVGGPGVTQAVVIRNGVLIWKGGDIDNFHHTWSCTKSFTSTALGLLIDDGRCSLDTPAKDDVPVLATAYSGVKLRHFTTMASGYGATGNDGGHGQSPTWWEPSTPHFVPGTRFEYWDSAMNQFAQTLTIIAGETLQSLFKRRIADRIGMTNWSWVPCGTVDGRVISGGAGNNGGISITAREFARFGHLFLNRGKWNGAQLISSAWVDQATRCQVPASVPLNPPGEIYGPGLYGFNWWSNGVQSNGARLYPAAPVGTFYAWGLNENRCWVIPEWNMVLVRLGVSGSHDDAAYNTFFQMLSGAMNAPVSSAPSVTGFTLVNADTDADLGPLANGATVNLATLPTRNLNVRANTTPSPTGSVLFGLDGTPALRIESTAPFALMGDSGGDYAPWTPGLGSHALSATPYSGGGATGTAGATFAVTFSVVDNVPPPPPGLSVSSFTLINADTDQDLGPLTNGASVNLATLPTRNLNVRANTNPATVASVRFGYDGATSVSVESAAPYAFMGDSGGDYAPWTPSAGSHTLTATPFSGAGATGTAGGSLSVTFTVIGGGSLIDTSPYRIGISFDGNQHDTDDIEAAAMSMAIIGEAGLGARLVHCDYGNHLGDNNPTQAAAMVASVTGAAQRWGIPSSVLFDCQTNLTGAVNGIRDAINASSSTNRFYLVCAGPMEVAWRGINASDPARRQYCTAISHSSWNDTHADTTQMTHTWSSIQSSGVQTVHIRDQNPGLQSGLSNWTWLRDSGVPAWSWLYGRNPADYASQGLFDCSDAGMVYYVVTGRGDQGADAATIRELFVNGPGNPTGTAPGPAVVSFTLVNADTDLDIGPLSNGATVNLSALPTRNLNVRANTNPATVGTVRFGLDSVASYRVESTAPYALAGDGAGNYNAWTPSTGSHTLVATAFDASGTSGNPLSISFTVADSSALKAAFVEKEGSTDGAGGSCGLLGIEAVLLLGLRRRKA